MLAGFYLMAGQRALFERVAQKTTKRTSTKTTGARNEDLEALKAALFWLPEVPVMNAVTWTLVHVTPAHPYVHVAPAQLERVFPSPNGGWVDS